MTIIFGAGASINLAVTLEPKVAFDPWVYDTNDSCYIEFPEWYQATQDYNNDLITEAQREQVDELYQYNVKNPACPNGGNGNDLLSRLKSGEVSANWWNYSSAERWQIAHYVGEYCASLPTSGRCARGARECAGAPYYQEQTCVCHHHGCIRYSIIGNCDTCVPADPGVGWGNNCFENYWEDLDGEWHCIYNPKPFKLPMYWSSLVKRWFTTPPGTILPPSHVICALLIESDLQNINSWLFFQYTDAEIVPLDKNVVTANRMEVGTLVTVSEIVAFNGFYNPGIKPGDPLSGWEITEAGAIPYYGPWEK